MPAAKLFAKGGSIHSPVDVNTLQKQCPVGGRCMKKVVSPSHRKEIEQWAVGEKKVSIRLACTTFSISETCYRYQPVLKDENAEIPTGCFI
jgi:hypothetical protein